MKTPVTYNHITAAHRKRMSNAYSLAIAQFIALAATKRERVTYGDLAGRFGGVARGYGDKLGGIAIRLREKGLPLLPVIVVNADTGMPSHDALLYEDLGLVGDEAIRAEQEKVYAFDWAPVLLNAKTS